MGMAASQARLLSITARIHDIEFLAQSVQNAKMQLATKSDRVYEEYMEALDAQTMTLTALSNGERSTVAATFNNLCSRNRLTPAASNTEYAMRDARGRLIVEDAIAEAYHSYVSSGSGSRSAQGFAMFMLCGSGGVLGNIEESEEKLTEAERLATSNLFPSEGEGTANSTLSKLYKDLLDLTPRKI